MLEDDIYKLRDSLKLENVKMFDEMFGISKYVKGKEEDTINVMYSLVSVLNDDVLQKIKYVTDRLKADKDLIPWCNDHYYLKLVDMNKDTISLNDLPINKPAMVIGNELGTIYHGDRGTGLSRGSIIVKLSESLIHCCLGTYWQIASSGKSYYIYEKFGYYEITSKTSGNVKLLEDVIHLQKSNKDIKSMQSF